MKIAKRLSEEAEILIRFRHEQTNNQMKLEMVYSC